MSEEEGKIQTSEICARLPREPKGKQITEWKIYNRHENVPPRCIIFDVKNATIFNTYHALLPINSFDKNTNVQNLRGV